jgi:hypothetical protein
MSFWLRNRLLESVLRLRVPPFAWFYAMVYGMARFLVVRSLHGRPGLIAIYLSGSSAMGRTRFGLSDIDFKIILAGRRNAEESQIIRRRFLVLRRFFPMLGPPDEKGIYFLDDFADEYRTYPLVRLLFDSRFYQHRLLWGRDWLAEQQLPLLGKDDLEKAFPWRLKEWNEKILLLLSAPSFAPPQRRYLVWKALADVGRFLSLLGHPSPADILPRAEAVSFLAEQLPAALRQSMNALRDEETRHFLLDKMSKAERFDLWREALKFSTDQFEPRTESPATAIVTHASDWSHSSDLHLQILEQALPVDARCILKDFFFIPSSPLDVDGYGSFVRLVLLPRTMRAGEYQTLMSSFRQGRYGREPVFVVEQGKIGHCLWSPMLDHYLVTASSADGFLPFVNAAEQGCAGYSTGALFIANLRRRLSRLIDQLPSVLDSPQVPRLGRERVLRFFFCNLQTLYLATEVLSEAGPPRVLHLPGGPAALVDLLVNRGLEDRVALYLRHKIHALHGSWNPVAWLSLKSLLVQALEVASHRRAWKDIALPEEQPLAISLVLITRNRARLLERCLDSICAQSRRPDELVVLDNGSTDNTAEVVRNFQPAFPVRYFFEPRPGVGVARAAGCRAATGDVLAFLDDDAIAEPGWLAALEESFYFDPRVGVVGGRIDALAGDRADWVSRAFGWFGEK